ncbi:MAG: hypothetical protein K0Q79_695 [Flavipsychrobacter sp.]|jgi:hypothetical protein|nr:hypothetical protein [Flavipsychrobacter sp.]
MQNVEKFQTFVNAIIESVKHRYLIEENEEITTLFYRLSSDNLKNKVIVRIKRSSSPLSYWRTLLLSTANNEEEYNLTLDWVASVKNELLDPESSDLYLFSFINDPDQTLDDCINLETNERFCRKYILRPKETTEDFLNRTFLALLASEKSNEEISDPLLVALSNTSTDNSWFNKQEQNKWREAFLSGQSSYDLIELLFSNSENSSHETPQ